MPTSTTIYDLARAYNARDWRLSGEDAGDDGALLNAALRQIAAASPANGLLFVPPGTYRVTTTVDMPSNVTLAGFGTATVLKLGPSANVPLLQSRSTSNVRLRDLRLDANRANNASGTGDGLWLNGVVDAWLENVEVVSARGDGFRLDSCARIELRGCKASDNGRHGFSLSYSEFCQMLSPRAYDNCQVATAGVGDGINLEMLSHHNSIIAALCYETAGMGDRQGYPVREQAGEGCHHNIIVGGAGWGNRTSNSPYIDSGDTVCLWPGQITLPAGVTIAP